MMYDNWALCYDTLMEDYDYTALLQFVQGRFCSSAAVRQVFARKGAPLILDLGCGSGRLTTLLAQSGYDMIGLDLSEEMLEAAKLRAEQCGLAADRILWICQDICKMDLFGTVAGMVCTTDVLNHLTTKKALNQFFKNAYTFLDDGGVLIFDALTQRHFLEAAQARVFFEDFEWGSCFWTCRYHTKSGICTYDISYFKCMSMSVQSENGISSAAPAQHPEPCVYERFDDTVRERLWDTETLCAAAAEAGFAACDVYGNLQLRGISKRDRRRYYVARK